MSGSAESLTVVCERGGAFESAHLVAAVCVSAGGDVVHHVGRPVVTTWRSAPKPFQLLGSLSLLPRDVVAALSAEDLALGAASHSGQPAHVRRVRTLLTRFGQSESALRCGAHPPIHTESAHDLIVRGGSVLPIHNNCSGKHAFILAATAAIGAQGSDYRDPRHPVQQRIREVVEEHTGGQVKGVVVDGCGVPCFVAPLEAMAFAWARLALAMHTADVAAAGDTLLSRIGRSMSAHPWWMSGDGRLDYALAKDAQQPMVSKVGAQGLICIAIPNERVGIALKVTTGSDEARAIAVQAVLDRWFSGTIRHDATHRWSVVRNVVGAEVGRRHAVWA